ncbi:beta-1,6-N-acetylglucosaminyltransferase [Pedobacter antarcticus]|uniref:beta-1,6-N-acetylglucosaminyltransferase n=1 Tax=Pedobacter antarcticus TaxID=34086 RepID=UPI00088BCD00|nr:beta-1,6-N-acetylglucosaminyltransferase [Pedobacter antarcticus]SDL39852.1 Core-2/I-Branching enzyme [Pedobacter antarcticus]
MQKENMKHAYLIIVHHQFEVLRSLLAALDDERNDLFIHFDKKIKSWPKLETDNARIFVVGNRVDVRWGNVSQIEAEYELFAAAHKKGPYLYYHLISGVHLPLCSQNDMHDFFDRLSGKDLLMKMNTSTDEIALKVQKYNLFTENYISSINYRQRFYQRLWSISIRFQRIFGVSVNKRELFYKAANWLSLTENSIQYVLDKKKDVLKKYKYTLCGDEFFVSSVLENSELRSNIMYYNNLLKCDFDGANPKSYTMSDYEDLMGSGCLFARKFSDDDLILVNRIVENIS